MRIIKIDKNSINLLNDFIANLGESSKTFRYFNTRKVSVIENHLVTIMLMDDEGKTYSYGHLEPFNNRIWLGICVIHEYIGKGFGKLILNELIKIAKEMEIEVISLSVDKDNVNAINLYEKNSFIRTNEQNSNCYFYELKISKNEY
jgi:RimJ/RimL family protein N-acetyltransferase